MKNRVKNFKLKILAIIFVFTGVLSLSLDFKHTVEVKATTIPDGYATDPINAGDDELVWIPDTNLRGALERKLGKTVGADITVGDMRSITTNNYSEMALHSKNISDLTGIDFAINANYLWLDNNKISDITPLSNMTQLKGLMLSNNKINDITPLSNLTNLISLNICENQISDISPLSNAINMGYLRLKNNQISDITPLKDMTNLISLDLSNNQISDITPLKDMTNLISLDLSNNQISDITPLSNMTQLVMLILSNNKISDIAPLENIKNLITLQLSNNCIDEIPNFIGLFTELRLLDLSANKISGEIPTELNNLSNLIYDSASINEPGYFTSFAGNQITGTIPSELKLTLNEPLAFANNLLEGEPNQRQLALKSSEELNLSLNSSITQNILKSLVCFDNGYGANENLLYELELVPTDESFFDESGRTIKSGTTTAYIKLKDVADTNTYAKTLTPVTVNISDKIGSNNDVTIDFSIDNSLEVTLGTNSINFGTISSVGGEIQGTTLTVTSSLPYDISTKAYDDFIGSLDSSNIIPIEKVSLDIDAVGEKTLSKVKTLNLGDN
ncbi:leucine-rich repeat domain-containing protein, partial [Clostridium sp.]|uniref:leucine-rich repeat domain-containing protein n=1 Tax=Clostridium sp. TaxID=1506 RepID=UPI001B6F5FF1